jgi:hypothetical protein
MTTSAAGGVGSDDPAVCADYLTVDPSSIGSGEEGDNGGNVCGLAQPLQWGKLREAVDDFLRFALKRA